MSSTSPKVQKDLGRKVKNFDVERWNKSARNIVYVGNFCKFSQNKELGDFLKSTEGKLLVEANPYDKIWGVGLAEDDYLILDCHNWLGTNWLGEVLTKVRITLFGN